MTRSNELVELSESELISSCKACGEFGVDPSKGCEVEVKRLFNRSGSTFRGSGLG